ncbi:bifunctional methyltransferase/pyrophosphohydrolase YabN [Alkalicoccobacillus murimartini]|uniref:Tetrapyrrole methylase family protein/MazG family protein n=1 Tax=Alkalicoccobacillus murimartini TaxID=171685 RepID=A0ABT9YMW6_9BACI|nr:nucleoside triphosphate pyrophosphohydrolase [Alkalicoccobacillus murimartini]MDQ0209195.1 tetrapyrrole methylase family protein/MazG family protein [Alkalicoccobacillus murimartini]
MGTIYVIGLGAGDLDQMPLGLYRHIKETNTLFVRTEDHPALQELAGEGLVWNSFDHVYESHDQFEAVYEEIVEKLFQAAGKADITYAVPGHPFVAERTIQLLVQQAAEREIDVEFLGGTSFLDSMYTALKIDPIEGSQILDGTSLNRDEFQLTQHLIIVQVYDAMVASDVKLTLMERLPDDYEVVVATAVGSSAESILRVPLHELDRVTTLNNLTAVYVPPVQDEALLREEFSTLRQVIAQLRGPNGCPWDKKQTHETLKPYLIEEAYEVLDAIDHEDDENLVEELGDVLLQVMLHAQIGEDAGWFSIQDVLSSVTNKMIRRHPHVFGEAEANSAEEVVSNWDEIKKAEKGHDTSSHLSSIPKGLPGLMKAISLQKSAAKVGFDWTEVDSIWSKLDEELEECKDELKRGNPQKMEQELGDILFTLANIARFYKLDAEQAISATNHKFQRRFEFMEDQVRAKGKDMVACSIDELEAMWQESKKTDK